MVGVKGEECTSHTASDLGNRHTTTTTSVDKHLSQQRK